MAYNDSELTPEAVSALKKVVKWVVTAVILLILVLWFWPVGQIDAGQRGVRLRFGAVTGDVISEGLYFKMPIVEQVAEMNVQVQKEQVKANAASKDLQTVEAEVALNYRIDPNKVDNIYQDVGLQYGERLIAPTLQEAVKASTARYTAEELVTKREIVANDISTYLKERLNNRGLLVEQFSIVNFNFSKAFDDAIEAKVSAEQNALAARNKLEQVKYEAQADIEKAKGRAEAIRVEAQALKDNPEVSELRAIEKWDGKLPTYTGTTTPFINLNR